MSKRKSEAEDGGSGSRAAPVSFGFGAASGGASPSEARKDKFTLHLRALNKQFARWVQEQAEAHSGELWRGGVKDYLKHADALLEEFADVLQEAPSTPTATPAKSPTASLTVGGSTVKFGTTPLAGPKPGSSGSPKPPAPSGLFSFGASAPASAAASSPAAASAPATGGLFAFGAAASSAPAATSAAAPSGLFSFGAAAASSAAASSPKAAGTFAFGAPAASAAASAPATFSFPSQPTASAPALFGDKAPEAKAPAAAGGGGGEDGDEDEEPKRASSPSLKEDDSAEKPYDTVFSSKAKLFLQAGSGDGWDDRGVGTLSVRKMKPTDGGSKAGAAFLVFVNTAGKALINASLYKGLTPTIGKNKKMVLMKLFMTEDGEQVSKTVLYKVATEAIAVNVKEAVEEHRPQ